MEEEKDVAMDTTKPSVSWSARMRLGCMLWQTTHAYSVPCSSDGVYGVRAPTPKQGEATVGASVSAGGAATRRPWAMRKIAPRPSTTVIAPSPSSSVTPRAPRLEPLPMGRVVPRRMLWSEYSSEPSTSDAAADTLVVFLSLSVLLCVSETLLFTFRALTLRAPVIYSGVTGHVP